MKQKKTIKQVLCMLLIICCTVTCFNGSMVQTHAAKDVTNSVSGKKNIKKLAGYFDSLCCYDIREKMKIGQKRKYDFSKTATRKRAMYYCGIYLCDPLDCAGSLENGILITASKNMFGKGIPKITGVYGEWGASFPDIKVEKVYKLSSDKYKVKAKVIWCNGDGSVDIIHKIGDLTLNLKKKPKSHYGYIVKSMTLKKTADV